PPADLDPSPVSAGEEPESPRESVPTTWASHPLVGAILPWVLGVLCFAVYLPHVCPVLFVGDSGELIVAAWARGIAHPPGYPLYPMLLSAWTHLPWRSPSAWEPAIFGPAYGANLFSLLCAALTVVVLATLLWRMTHHAAWVLLGALSWMVTATFFSQA